jgi:hypothetical protein
MLVRCLCCIGIWAVSWVAWADAPPSFTPSTVTESVDLPKFPPAEADPPARLTVVPAAEQATCTFALSSPEGKPGKPSTRYELVKNTGASDWFVFASRGLARSHVGTLGFDGDDVVFRWQAGTTRGAASGFRNCLLRVKNGLKTTTIAMRAAVQSPAPSLDLRRNLNTIRIATEDLPDDSNLALEVVRLTGYDPVASEASKRMGFNEPLRIQLKAPELNAPAVELDLVLMKNGSQLNLNVRPLAVATQGPALPFTLKSVDLATTQLANQIEAAKAKVAFNVNEIPALEARILSFNGTPVRNASELEAIRATIARLQAQIAELQAENKQLDVLIPALQKQLEAMPALVKLASDLHQSLTIEFRVLSKVGGREVELLTTSKLAADESDPSSPAARTP